MAFDFKIGQLVADLDGKIGIVLEYVPDVVEETGEMGPGWMILSGGKTIFVTNICSFDWWDCE